MGHLFVTSSPIVCAWGMRALAGLYAKLARSRAPPPGGYFLGALPREPGRVAGRGLPVVGHPLRSGAHFAFSVTFIEIDFHSIQASTPLGRRSRARMGAARPTREAAPPGPT